MGQKVNKRELAGILDVSERSLTEWQAQGMPIEVNAGRGSSNQYDTALVVTWMVERAKAGGAKESARDRLDRIRANREELAFAKDLEEVVVAADLIERFDAMITAAKVELLNTLPDNLASELSARYGVEVDDQLIREPIEAILRKMADYDPDDDALSDGDSDEPDDSEAAAEDRD
ncbi:Phage DNA packaging protein, Nu1 subunit of terminase [Azotobacter beijerinckii]|uniref:Phage DNA packaging protein, Nu1 subunit of terminase n=1 Tax=Azotobacter beijerinckii TaxID=170623 RepID=A0A1H6VH28_9GAMM|nr:terminase small subunit [Azotobacter beijerinckii]SEI99505.1 Phage DNA packaging protein, Nu1 subunit of terminase [Azotobacter beijerinckii]